MENFDLGIAYLWEYDIDFVNLAEKEMQAYGLSTFIISSHNIYEATERILNREISFNFYLDRGSDVDEHFESLGKILNRRKTIIFNPYRNVQHAIDKANMHLEFISAGLNVPYSIIIPPQSVSQEVYLSLEELSILGRPFIIKPCNTTGGGMGVVTGAETLKEVIDERHTFTNDKYILQEKIYPAMLDGKRAWFRCFWAFGKAIPVWWDDQTHLYNILTPEEISRYNLKKLYAITRTIARITQLDFFSLEAVYTNKGNFIAIDYVNDQCDMRIKSLHVDGVPDEIVNEIITNLRRTIQRIKRTGAKSAAAGK